MAQCVRIVAVCLALALSSAAQALQPIVSDSRIKTFVYNPNEVFAVTTEYGYQSNIEFGENESIDTVSVGDRVGWQIIPADRRLFIRAMENNAHTNMTVVTNRRAYQFDLKAANASEVIGSEQLVYVVRFYYPGESEGPAPMSMSYAPPPMPLAASYGRPSYGMAPSVSYAPPAPAYSAAPMIQYAAPQPSYAPATTAPVAASAPAGMNFRYTYSGNSTIAPVKIYDDGRSTFFKFRGAKPGSFAVITTGGDELSVPARMIDAETVAVDAIATRFSIRQSGQQVVVYNESNGA